MIKIREGVDLKELEKFGFEFNDEKGLWRYRTIQDIPLEIIINAWNKKIRLFSNTHTVFNIDILDVLYDLIQADLIEKVSE